MTDRLDDRYAGKYLGRHHYLVDEDLIGKYVAVTGDDHPWYQGSSPWGHPVAPALLFHSESYAFPTAQWYLPSRTGTLHVKQQWELFRQIRVGSTVSTSAMVVDRYQKRDRDVVVLEVTVIDEEGAMTARSRCHQSFLCEVTDRASVVAPGDERAKKPRPGSRVDGAQTFSSTEKLVDVEQCLAFSGPGVNLHTDRQAARGLGFPEIVVQGTMSTTFISSLMTREFGRGWYEGGRLDLSFVNVLWCGESVRAKGAVAEHYSVGSRRRAMCQVWTEKPDGTTTTIGTAGASIVQ